MESGGANTTSSPLRFVPRSIERKRNSASKQQCTTQSDNVEEQLKTTSDACRSAIDNLLAQVENNASDDAWPTLSAATPTLSDSDVFGELFTSPGREEKEASGVHQPIDERPSLPNTNTKLPSTIESVAVERSSPVIESGSVENSSPSVSEWFDDNAFQHVESSTSERVESFDEKSPEALPCVKAVESDDERDGMLSDDIFNSSSSSSESSLSDSTDDDLENNDADEQDDDSKSKASEQHVGEIVPRNTTTINRQSSPETKSASNTIADKSSTGS